MENKYKQTYDRIIERARNRDLSGVFERHHVIPRCMGGSDDGSNLVKLTCREHYICHLLLTKFDVDSQTRWRLIWALHRMAFSGVLYSRGYELARILHRANMANTHNYIKDRERWKKNVALSFNTPGRREANARAVKRLWVADHEKMAKIARENGKLSQNVVTSQWAVIQYEGVTYYGWKRFEESTGVSRYDYEKYYLNNLTIPQQIIENTDKRHVCPHCNKSGGRANMRRWHFDNCKQKGGVSLC